MQELGAALHDIAKNPSKPTLKVNSTALGRQSSAPPDLPPLVSSSDAHRVEDEVLLDDPFQNKELQDALSRSKELMAKLDNDLSSSSLVEEPESTIGRLRHRVHELAAFHCPASRIVGFVGDSGVGKFCRRRFKNSNITMLTSSSSPRKKQSFKLSTGL